MSRCDNSPPLRNYHREHPGAFLLIGQANATLWQTFSSAGGQYNAAFMCDYSNICLGPVRTNSTFLYAPHQTKSELMCVYRLRARRTGNQPAFAGDAEPDPLAELGVMT